jgi:hypothetical protein
MYVQTFLLLNYKVKTTGNAQSLLYLQKENKTRTVHQGVNPVFSACLIVCLSAPINDSLMSSLVVVGTG